MVTIKRKKRAKYNRSKTTNRLKQSQKASLRHVSASRGALIGRTAASSKQVQRAVLRAGGDKTVL
jgi:hypothetical protein